MSADFRSVARSAATIATGQLGWSPTTFWNATVMELALAMEGRFGAAAGPPLGRAELDRLERGSGNGR